MRWKTKMFEKKGENRKKKRKNDNNKKNANKYVHWRLDMIMHCYLVACVLAFRSF